MFIQWSHQYSFSLQLMNLSCSKALLPSQCWYFTPGQLKHINNQQQKTLVLVVRLGSWGGTLCNNIKISLLSLFLSESTDSRKTYTLENYLNSDYQYKTHDLQWISGNLFLYIAWIWIKFTTINTQYSEMTTISWKNVQLFNGTFTEWCIAQRVVISFP